MGRSHSFRYRRRRSRLRTAAAAAALAASLVAGQEAVVDPSEHTGNRGQTQDQGRVDSVPRQGPGKGPEGDTLYKGFSAYGMRDVGEECTPSPLWVKDVDASSYELGCEDIEDMLANNTRLVGEGRVRKVYLAEYGEQTVAVKVLQHQSDTRLQQIEVATMDAVRGNPHIVQTLGICNTTVVTEAYMLDIQSAVRKRMTALPIGEAVTMSLDAVRGLQALHEAVGGPIVHFDIKPAQLLVTGNGRVKLNDFNVAWFMSRRPDGKPCPFNMLAQIRNSGPWRAPEYLTRKDRMAADSLRRWRSLMEYAGDNQEDAEDNQEPMTEKIDIYRMGLVLRKFVAGEGMRIPGAREAKGAIPVFRTTWHRSYSEIVQDMIAVEATQRPSAREVSKRLEVILQGLPQVP
ncbi:similar to TAK1 (TGF-beta-activated kinase) [Ectocarpus siliculosus]|uniref:Similar to TAK1 (TGF-beta-activated kinase) n=1 Tax=Ectocarpus siliculosus TaxID=2880 RepID=D7G3F3_ECTSI|nr:similar to TAK1 (TGF-beta-activated kinase) [Ectocarpus siliculosus]|eukprot:CBJ26951.1 similar to TAK1 (TGF-beta-activated kinase) [Ectocarpus siliculosus]